jgi:ribosome-interacting GTPase 1
LPLTQTDQRPASRPFSGCSFHPGMFMPAGRPARIVQLPQLAREPRRELGADAGQRPVTPEPRKALVPEVQDHAIL